MAKKLKKVIGELKKASKMHLAQSEIIKDHIKTMSPVKKYKSDAQRKAVHASKAERSSFKMHGYPMHSGTSPLYKKGPCWKGYEMIGTKKKGGRTVPNCVPKKKK